MRRVLLVTGARVLETSKDASAWACAHLQRLIETLPQDAVVVTGDAAGPDRWARTFATQTARIVIVYDKDGYRRALLAREGLRGKVSILEHRPWTTPLPDPRTSAEWREVLLLRDRIMVAEVAAAHRTQKIEASVVAFYAPDGWSKTHGTRYTATRAKDAGLHVEPFTYEPAESIEKASP